MTTTRDAAQTIEARKARYSRELAAYTLRQWDLVRDTVGSTNGHNDRDKSSTPSASSRQGISRSAARLPAKSSRARKGQTNTHRRELGLYPRYPCTRLCTQSARANQWPRRSGECLTRLLRGVDISGKIITHLLHKSFYRAKVESFDTRAIGIVLQLYDWSGPVYRKALPEGMCRVIRDLYCEFAVRKGD
ncbi:hypothetical protein BC628DRAFT_1337981 [Trametes gibbosa]|nr:hypothetical protein BC628DRAFT_1337981 [Trametes gibbosa]